MAAQVPRRLDFRENGRMRYESTSIRRRATACAPGVSVDEMRAHVAAARSTVDTLGATSREAATEATGMSRAGRDAVSGLHNLNDASDRGLNSSDTTAGWRPRN